MVPEGEMVTSVSRRMRREVGVGKSMKVPWRWRSEVGGVGESK